MGLPKIFIYISSQGTLKEDLHWDFIIYNKTSFPSPWHHKESFFDFNMKIKECKDSITKFPFCSWNKGKWKKKQYNRHSLILIRHSLIDIITRLASLVFVLSFQFEYARPVD